MGWLGRGLGDFGSQVGEGYATNLDWRTKLQNLAMRNAQQKIADLKGPLELQELQQRIKQMGQPQAAGMVKGPGGETSGVTFDPATSTYSVKTLIPGAPAEPKFPTLQAAAAYYLQKGDIEKLKAVNDEIERNKTQKAVPDPKDAFELWRKQNPDASVAEWLKLQERYKKTAGTEGGTKTPFELWMQQHPKGTYDQWIGESKQTDRGDATKAVTNAMNAFKNYQSQNAAVQKYSAAVPIYKPWQHFTGQSELERQAAAAKNDYDLKRQDAIQKLQNAGMDVPQWLMGGAPAAGVPPPPPGFHP